MATPITFQVFQADGFTPETAAAPSIVNLLQKNGTNAFDPANVISHVTEGRYKLIITDAQEALGCVVLIATGATPAYVCRSIAPGTSPFASLVFFNTDGTLISAGSPGVGGYATINGGPIPPPALVSANAYLWTLTPPTVDLEAGGVLFLVNAPAGKIPEAYEGDLFRVGSTGAIPVVSAFVPFNPPSAGQIQPTDAIGFDVTCVDGFSNIMITCGFAGFETREEVYDGFAPSVLYATGFTKTAITNGFRFLFRRKGGFPGAPRLKIRAVSLFGVENA